VTKLLRAAFLNLDLYQLSIKTTHRSVLAGLNPAIQAYTHSAGCLAQSPNLIRGCRIVLDGAQPNESSYLSLR